MLYVCFSGTRRMSSQEHQHQQRSNPAGNGGDGERQNDGNCSLVMFVTSEPHNYKDTPSQNFIITVTFLYSSFPVFSSLRLAVLCVLCHHTQQHHLTLYFRPTQICVRLIAQNPFLVQPYAFCGLQKCIVWVQKILPPKGPDIFISFTNGWEFLIDFLIDFLHTYYSFLSMLDYKFLFNYPRFWWSCAILSATTQFTQYAQNVRHRPKRMRSHICVSRW